MQFIQKPAHSTVYCARVQSVKKDKQQKNRKKFSPAFFKRRRGRGAAPLPLSAESGTVFVFGVVLFEFSKSYISKKPAVDLATNILLFGLNFAR